MSRSVSAPSSVTKTSPCWNGDIVPGSTFRYGSNFWSCTRRPRAFSRRPSDAATIPLPSAETTPPVTKTYFGARVLTGFQGSSGRGRTSRLLPGPEQSVQSPERLARKRAAHGEPPRVDDELRVRAPLVPGAQRELGLDPVVDHLEREPLERHDVEHEQGPVHLRPPEVGRLVRPDDDPTRAGCEPAPVRLDAGDARPPVGQVVRLGDECPDVVERRAERAVSRVPRQGTPARPASARARPCAPRPRAG